MADVLGKILLEILREIIWRCAGSLLFKAAVWLDTTIPERRTKIIVGMICGLAAFFIIPMFAGLLGF